MVVNGWRGRHSFGGLGIRGNFRGERGGRARLWTSMLFAVGYSRRQEKRVKPVYARTLRSLQRNILAGIITIGPLFVTYLVFSFLLGVLAKAGLPVVWLLAAILPGDWLTQPWLQSLLAILLTLVVLYVVGRVTSL